MHKRLVSFCLGFLAVLPLAALPVHAADKPKKVKYVAPEGFAGRKWGELRSTFDRLPTEPVGVGAAWMSPVEKKSSFTCVPVSAAGPQMSRRDRRLRFPGDAAAHAQGVRRRRLLRAVRVHHRGSGLSLRRRERRRGAAPGDLPVLRELGRDQARGAAEVRRDQQVLRRAPPVPERYARSSCASCRSSTSPTTTACWRSWSRSSATPTTSCGAARW